MCRIRIRVQVPRHWRQRDRSGGGFFLSNFVAVFNSCRERARCPLHFATAIQKLPLSLSAAISRHLPRDDLGNDSSKHEQSVVREFSDDDGFISAPACRLTAAFATADFRQFAFLQLGAGLAELAGRSGVCLGFGFALRLHKGHFTMPLEPASKAICQVRPQTQSAGAAPAGWNSALPICPCRAAKTGSHLPSKPVPGKAMWATRSRIPSGFHPSPP